MRPVINHASQQIEEIEEVLYRAQTTTVVATSTTSKTVTQESTQEEEEEEGGYILPEIIEVTSFAPGKHNMGIFCRLKSNNLDSMNLQIRTDSKSIFSGLRGYQHIRLPTVHLKKKETLKRHKVLILQYLFNKLKL